MLLIGKLGSQPDRISGPDNLVIDEVECALIELLAVLTIDEEVTSPRDMRSWTRTKFASGSVKIVIDPRPYQAELDQAIANRDRDQAHLENAEIDLNRYNRARQGKINGDTARCVTSTKPFTSVGWMILPISICLMPVTPSIGEVRLV